MKSVRRVITALSLLVFVLLSNSIKAQNIEIIALNSTTNGTTRTLTAAGAQITDDNFGPNGRYEDSVAHEYTLTISGQCSGDNKLGLTFSLFDIREGDTLFIHDGPTVAAPVIVAANNSLNPLLFRSVFPTAWNTSNTLTIRFKTNGDEHGDLEHPGSGAGFAISAICRFPCEEVTAVIDSFFYKTRNGVITDTVYSTMLTQRDTTVYEINDTTFDGTQWVITHLRDSLSIDSSTYPVVYLCQGEGIIFNGHGEYTHTTGLYNPMDMTSEFIWELGNASDSVRGLNMTRVDAFYDQVDCYDILLTIIDEQGCANTNYSQVQIRISKNPIKTIYNLMSICNVDSVMVSVGYGGNNTISLDSISHSTPTFKNVDCMTFIPDGPHCDVRCFQAPVKYDEYPRGRSIASKEDVCSICINYEHSFMGDYDLSLICPNGQKATLKYKENNGSLPQGAFGGGGTFTGYPYGAPNDGGYDNFSDPSRGNPYCDQFCNMYGVGKWYCFSRNEKYVLVDGSKANDPTIGQNYLGNSNYIDQITDFQFDPIPAPFVRAGEVPRSGTFRSKHPSVPRDVSNPNSVGYDYYKPADDFTQLIGCPLNGEWNAEICDHWGADNGWIFAWNMELCNISVGAGCKYQVLLDSVVWTPDSLYGDFDLGHYRGLNVRKEDSVTYYISSPDTAGYFKLDVALYDQFGCVWDTNTFITTVWTPEPNLGNDTLLCDVETFTLNAADRHTPTNNYEFLWEPFGEDVAEIETHSNQGGSTLYTVEVTNTDYVEQVRCRTRDSIRVNVNHQPSPNFDPGIYPLEGCEPFTINITNTSEGGARYRWVFGDGDTSVAMSPSHTYAAGVYNFKYYIYSEGGCVDSLIYDSLVTVYSSPVAKYSWEPVHPTVLHPTVNFINRTEPMSPENKYYWEIQYDRDNPLSYHTLTDVNPDFTWDTDGDDISGNYITRLIVKTSTMGPSGNVIECRDTIENKILLVNDFLQFPTVVTANGDGVNDKFVIVNLVSGFGYPNNSLAIYNRWGKRVYYKENISSDDDWWDPAKDNIPAGTYFWRFSGKGYLGDIERNGAVEVLR